MFDFSKDFVNSLIKKDKQYFDKFYIETVDIFYRYLKSNYFLDDQEAEDILSQFYIKVWNNLGKYSFDYSFESWVWTVFKNVVKDSFKKRKYFGFSQLQGEDESFNYEETLISNEEEIMELMEKNFRYEVIQDAIEKLDDESKDIIYFRFVQQYSNKEISNILWITQMNVRQKVSRAIKKLKQNLDQYWD